MGRYKCGTPDFILTKMALEDFAMEPLAVAGVIGAVTQLGSMVPRVFPLAAKFIVALTTALQVFRLVRTDELGLTILPGAITSMGATLVSSRRPVTRSVTLRSLWRPPGDTAMGPRTLTLTVAHTTQPTKVLEVEPGPSTSITTSEDFRQGPVDFGPDDLGESTLVTTETRPLGPRCQPLEEGLLQLGAQAGRDFTLMTRLTTALHVSQAATRTKVTSRLLRFAPLALGMVPGQLLTTVPIDGLLGSPSNGTAPPT